jgi:hypothetical protein
MKIQNSDELNFPYFLLSDVDTEKQELPILFRLKGHLSTAPLAIHYVCNILNLNINLRIFL